MVVWDGRHGYVTDPNPISPKHWLCTPKRWKGSLSIRRQVKAAWAVSLCSTDDGGKHWRLAWTDAQVLGPNEQPGHTEDVVSLWRGGPQGRIGELSIHWEAAEGDGHDEYITRHGGRGWRKTEFFDVGLPHSWSMFSASPYVTAVHFRGRVFDLRVVTPSLVNGVPEGSTCEDRQYGISDWPLMTAEPVLLSSVVCPGPFSP
jgi:hypothetical protein